MVNSGQLFAAFAFIWQLLLLILYGVFVDYDDDVKPVRVAGNVVSTGMGFYYPMFQDVHIMIFIGFGFLMTFLKKYGNSATGYNLLIACFAFQWAILVVNFWHNVYNNHWSDKVKLEITSMVTGDFGAGAVLISFGAVLGKTNALQLLVMVFFEIIFYAFNEMLGVLEFQAVDMGGSMYVHMFGAVFGVAASTIVSPKAAKSSANEGSTRTSDTFAMIGTIFLWCFWPSFNGVLASGNQQHRVAVNTVLALTASCTMAFVASALLRPGNKFSGVDIQNATLAGGVAVGSSSDLVIGPVGAIAIGMVAGLFCVIGYTKIQPFLAKFGIHDTCGVMNLHGLSGFIGAIGGVISAGIATDHVYGEDISAIFAARADGRSAGGQAMAQLAATGTTLGLSIVGGLITGFIMSLPVFGQPKEDGDMFDDAPYWGLEEEEHGEGAKTEQI